MRVLGLILGFALLLSVGLGIAAQNAPTDARRAAAIAVADASIEQSGAARRASVGRGATVAAPRGATMANAPTPAVDSGDEMFIGTGDGSNGFWVRP